MNTRLATYPNSEAERETLKAVDDAVFQRAREWEQYLVQAARQARVDAQVDTTAAQDTIDALQGEIRFALDRPIGEVQNNIGELAARYKTLRVTAERAIEALGRADHNEEVWAAKLADPYADLVALWSRWPMVRPQV
jgi:hypothetical protein